MRNSIEVDNISKYFRLYQDSYTLFRTLKRCVGRRSSQDGFWALRDINFSAKPGQAIGIIGDNGSGKTTLLRIIAGIYKQTKGDIRINAKVGGSFQLGMAIHRDLSGLENIFLIGAVMGIGRKDINRRLKAIVKFSELGEFIHTPLRNYSTGMLQKLAVSVVKELDAGIIFFDELLVSGDSNFREKCFEFLIEHKEKGKTLIVASHSMDIINKLCDKVLLLDKGKQIVFASSKEALEIYTKHKF